MTYDNVHGGAKSDRDGGEPASQVRVAWATLQPSRRYFVTVVNEINAARFWTELELVELEVARTENGTFEYMGLTLMLP